MGSVTRPNALTARQERLLFAVCRDYLMTGRPVSSRGLIRSHGFGWSSATIRGELAELERQGLLNQPHHSSGRLPTGVGLERYVGSLALSGTPEPEVARALDRTLGEVTFPAQGMRAAVHVLSEAVGCVAVSFVGVPRSGLVTQLDLTSIGSSPSPCRALAAVTLEDGSTTLHPVTLEPSSLGPQLDGDARLRRLQERLRGLCVGRTLPQARELLLELIADGQSRLDGLLTEALRLGLAVTAAASLDPLWLQVAGQATLAGAVGREDDSGAVLGDLLELFEDVHRLAEILCQLLPEHRGEQLRAAVRIGPGGLLAGGSKPSGGVYPRVVPTWLTLVGCRFAHPQAGSATDARTGALAVLGSDRMDYGAVIPLVEYAARALALRTGT